MVDYGLIILDIMMPVWTLCLSGRSVRLERQSSSWFDGRDSLEDKIRGLGLGKRMIMVQAF